MKANELRIGNLVRSNNPNARPQDLHKIGMVTAIDSQREFKEWKEAATICLIEDEYRDTFGQFICFLEPIPLIEDWLLRMGFEKSQRRTDWDYKLSISAINLYCRFNKQWYFELEGIYLGSKPKHVHQLQNLYYALTGDELTIK